MVKMLKSASTIGFSLYSISILKQQFKYPLRIYSEFFVLPGAFQLDCRRF